MALNPQLKTIWSPDLSITTCIKLLDISIILCIIGDLNSISMLQAGAAMGAILSIGWSSGRLQQLPLVFGGPDSEGEVWSQHPDPTLNLFSVSD